MTPPTRVAIVVGGIVGTLVRYALAHLPTTGGLPLGTLAANLVGALALGAVVGWLGPRRGDPRFAGVTAGLLGATTTFSTFAVESAELLTSRPAVGVAYAVGSVTAGLALLRIGRRIGASGSAADRPVTP